MIMVPIFVVVMMVVPYPFGDIIGVALFIIASVTDMLDGKIARKHNLITDFGKFIDPLADKFMVIGALLVILYKYEQIRPLFIWAVIIVVFRELAVTSIRLVASSSSGIVIAANWLGKIKTVTQIVCVCCVIIEPMLYGMSDSVQPAVGYNWGAGNLKRVSGITKVSFTVCGLVSVLCATVMFLFPRPLTSLFVNAEKSPELMALAVHAVPFFGLAFLFGWFCFAVQGFFAAIEKPFFATVVSICFAIITPVSLIYALSPMGLDGLWLNYFGRSLLTGIIAVILIIIAQKHMKKDIEKYQVSKE